MWVVRHVVIVAGPFHWCILRAVARAVCTRDGGGGTVGLGVAKWID